MTGKDRPRGMSQLDYLWTHYSDYYVSTTASETPSNEVILTEDAIVDLINKAESAGVVDLEYRDHPTDSSLVLLVGVNIEGEEIAIVDMPKVDNVSYFGSSTVTEEDITNGCPFELNTTIIKLELTSGLAFYINLQEAVNSNISISSEDTGVDLTIKDDGLSASIPLGNTDYIVRFQQLTSEEYNSLDEIKEGTVYFITDSNSIYLNGYRYGATDLSDSYIVSITYSPSNCVLTYRKADGTTSTVNLGLVSEDENGMFSSGDYIKFNQVLLALEWQNINS